MLDVAASLLSVVRHTTNSYSPAHGTKKILHKRGCFFFVGGFAEAKNSSEENVQAKQSAGRVHPECSCICIFSEGLRARGGGAGE